MTRRIGFALLALVVVVVVGYQFLAGRGGSSLPGAPGFPGVAGAGRAGGAAVVKGSLGGEKVGLLKDPEIVRLLRDRHHLTVDYARAGSLDMVRDARPGQDFLWPGSQLALEIYKEKGGKYVQAEILFNSPIVLYSRGIVTGALVEQGIVEQTGGVYYVKDAPKLVRMITGGKQWKDIGLSQLYGKMTVICTDPARSNSGNMFAGLLANLLNGGEVADEVSLTKVLPGVKQFFGRLGYMQPSSSDLFNQFLQQGVGSFPLIAGYEAQLVEFAIENPGYRDTLQKDVHTLYPRPTVWSSHPLIALTAGGGKLLAAFQDPDIQRLAWERHGFRSAISGTANDPKKLPVTGVPTVIENVMPMPKPRVMEKIIAGVSSS